MLFLFNVQLRNKYDDDDDDMEVIVSNAIIQTLHTVLKCVDTFSCHELVCTGYMQNFCSCDMVPKSVVHYTVLVL